MCRVDLVLDPDRGYARLCLPSVLVVDRCCVGGEEREEVLDSGSL